MSEQTEFPDYTAHLHKLLVLWPLILVIPGAMFIYYFPDLYYFGVFFVVVGVILMVVNLLTYLSTYVRVTQDGVLLQSGIFIIDSVEIPLAKIESIDIRQDLLGSILNYGTLIVTGTGGTRRYLHFIAEPLTCRRHIEQAISHR